MVINRSGWSQQPHRGRSTSPWPPVAVARTTATAARQHRPEAQKPAGRSATSPTRRPPSTSTRSASTSVATSSNLSRLVYRSLVTFPVTEDDSRGVRRRPRPGHRHRHRPPRTAKTWSFTLRDGVKWQDGQPVTCEDFKYGVSRTFATDVITGGPNYILGYLDVPKDADGLPVYNGPYTGDDQDALRQGRDLRRQHDHLPVQQAVAGLPARASRRCARSTPTARTRTRATSRTSPSSRTVPTCSTASGTRPPGGTFVRNPEWDAATDDRSARPTRTRSSSPRVDRDRGHQRPADRRLAVTTQYAVTDRRVPPAYYTQITGPVADRAARGRVAVRQLPAAELQPR